MKRVILYACVFVLASLFFAGVVEAHAGGKMQVASADAGPFKLTVWTSPDPALVGQVHVATAVASAEDALPVLDANVFIQLAHQENQETVLTGQATTQDSVNRLLYEKIFDVPEKGLYQVTLTVTGQDGQKGEVVFDLEVADPPPLVFGLIALGVLAVITGGAVWFYLQSTSSQPGLEEVDEPDAG